MRRKGKGMQERLEKGNGRDEVRRACLQPVRRQGGDIDTQLVAHERVELIPVEHPRAVGVDALEQLLLVAQLLRDSGEHLYHVHLNDANKRGPGFGETDFVSVIKTLKELDYQRYVSVEVFDFAPDPKTIAAGSLHYLKGIAAAL